MNDLDAPVTDATIIRDILIEESGFQPENIVEPGLRSAGV